MLKKNIIFSTVISILVLILGTSVLFANGDDDHSKGESNKAESNQKPYAEGFTGNFEAVVTLENVKANEASTQKIYLSDYNTNTPVENAEIQIEITGVDNSKITTPTQIEPGVYEFSVEFPEIKKYDFLFNVTSGDINDLIVINEVDLANTQPTDNTETNEDSSFIVKAFENWLWLILFIILISTIAYIFYRIGKRSNSKIIIPEANNPATKYEA
ncbi:MAG: hypothetical protein ABIY50_06850 [Ignavibacteria bacterium]